MAERAKKTQEAKANSTIDYAQIAKLLLKITNEGFVPTDVLAEEFGPEVTTQAVGYLCRNLGLIVEARKPWKDGVETRGYMRADKMLTRKKLDECPPQIQEILKLVGGWEKSKAYGQFVRIVAECRYVTQALGAFPRKHADKGDVNAFEKDEAGRFIVPAYCLRAMMVRALPLIGKEQAIAYRIAFQTLHVEAPKPLWFQAPVIDERGNGCGINTYEAIPPGTVFRVDAVVPSTHLREADYVAALRLAGTHVRLSPARSTAWGEFEVLSVKEG